MATRSHVASDKGVTLVRANSGFRR